MASGTEIFRLFGSILIDSTEADKSLSKTDSGAKRYRKRWERPSRVPQSLPPVPLPQ